MTANQAFNYAMNEHALLYASPTLEQAQFKYYDQTFNVLGNGLSDMDDFIQEHTITEENRPYLDSFPSKYIGEHDLYLVFVEQAGRIGSDTALPGLYTKDEVKKMKNKTMMSRINGKRKEEDLSDNVLVPYPNFQKSSSLVWKVDLRALDVSWAEAAKVFYLQAKEFFNSKEINRYSDAFPVQGEKREEEIRQYTEIFTRIGAKKSQEEQYAYITQQYGFGVEYNGNVVEFLEKRWNLRKIEISQFLDDTLEHLDNILSHQVDTTNKPGIKK